MILAPAFRPPTSTSEPVRVWFALRGCAIQIALILLLGASTFVGRAAGLDIVSAQTRGNSHGVTVTFSVPVSPLTATNPANYTIAPGVQVESVTLLEMAKVRLHTTEIIGGRAYVLTVSGVTDRSDPPNVIPPGTLVTFLQTHGGITRREFHDIPGVTLSALTSHPKFTGPFPDRVDLTPSFETPVDVRNDYGVQMAGYLIPPATGDYSFYLNSDDEGALWLSTDEAPANKRLIANEPQWNGSREFIQGSNQNPRIHPPASFFEGGLFIEAEDFDFGGGQFVEDAPIGIGGAYTGGAFRERGSSADADIDWHEGNPANDSPVYRPGTGVETSVDAGFLAGSRGAFTVSPNWVVGWCDPGDWMNYTREFPLPAREYHVFASLSSGGGSMAARLDEVTAGRGTSTQTTVALGRFEAPATGHYSAFTLVPLRDANQNAARITLGGRHTLRFTTLPGNLAADYLLLLPAGSGDPDWSALRPINRSAPIRLEAFRPYYIEARMKEGTGGDNLAVAWRPPGGPEVTNGFPPISGDFLSGLEPLVPATFVTQPASLTVNERDPVTFSLTLAGTAPYDYQWYRNGQPIPGANGPQFAISSATVADHNARFHVVAGNGLTSLQSQEAVLTVQPDLEPPRLVSVKADFEGDRVVLVFSEGLNPAEAGDPSNYTLDGGVTVEAANLQLDGRTVVLKTSLQALGTHYTLRVRQLRDLAATPNHIADGTEATFDTYTLTRGFLRHEVWENLPGPRIADLVGSPHYPDDPTTVRHVTWAESPFALGDNFGARLRGFLLPPTTGDYVFYLASDDEGEFWLSPDESPAHLQLIAREPQWNGFRQWTAGVNQGSRGNPPANVSAPIHLTAGQRYRIELRFKEEAGGDHISVAWRKPGDPELDRMSTPIPGAYLATLANPTGASIAFLTGPIDVSATSGQTATFAVETTGSTRERFFQWQRNGEDIPGANGPIYVTSPTTPADRGTTFRCFVSVPGASVVSPAATLNVTTDNQPPALSLAEGTMDWRHVRLEFSEPIDASDATNPARFQMNGGVNVLAARPLQDGSRILLTTTPQEPGVEYTVTVTGVRDRSPAGNAVLPGTQAAFFAWESDEFVGPFPSWADVRRDFGAVGDGVADDTAALQAALDGIGGDDTPASNTRPHALWLPAGTYRITRTLRLTSRMSVNLFGEHPDTTRIRWDGPPDGVMFEADGVSYSRFGRLTWDGAQHADTAFLHSQREGRFQVTSVEHVDDVFVDVRHGLRVNPVNGGDTVTVTRCRFLRCTGAGALLQSFNAIDWHFWHCLFEDCGRGVSSQAGSFHVYESRFLRSTDMDLYPHWGYYGIRRNVSIGSRAFLNRDFSGSYSAVTLVGNTILEPGSYVPISLSTRGPLVMLDNYIQSRPEQNHGHLVYAADNLFALGNTFTVPDPFLTDGRPIVFDTRIQPTPEVPFEFPELPGVAARPVRPVIEVPSGANAAVIQAAIDTAAALNVRRPIVHLPRGRYPIEKTLTIPPQTDLQLVGDGLRSSTILAWTGGPDGPVLRMLGPSKARVRNLTIDAYTSDGHITDTGTHVVGIAVENPDQPGARVHLDQVVLYEAARAALTVDRLEHTLVRGDTLVFGAGASTGIEVIGTGDLRRPGRVNFYGGGTNGGRKGAKVYRLHHGARLMAQDLWFEGSTSRFLQLDEPAEFIIDGATTAMDDPGHGGTANGIPALDFAATEARITLLNLNLRGPDAFVAVDPDASPGFELLALGIHGDVPPWRPSARDATLRVHLPHQNQSGGGDADLASFDPEDPVLLSRGLDRIRHDVPRPLARLAPGVTDVRIDQVTVDGATVGVLVHRGNSAPSFAANSPEQQVVEETTLVVANAAHDPDEPFDTLSYSLGPGAPTGVTVDSKTGTLTWTPTEEQGPRTYPISILVRDDSAPRLFATNQFTIVVAEGNRPPSFGVTGWSTNSELPSSWNLGWPGYLTQNWRTDVTGPGAYRMIAGGTGFYGDIDVGRLSGVEVAGDFDVRVRVSEFASLGSIGQAGLMARENGDGQGRAVLATVHPQGPAFRDGQPGRDAYYAWFRSVFAASNRGWIDSPVVDDVHYPNAWVRLTREGQTFQAFRSDNGVDWTRYGRTTLSPALPNTLLVGLCLSANANGSYVEEMGSANFEAFQLLQPTIVPISDFTVGEGRDLSISLRATDLDLPPNRLTFSVLPGAPSGLTLDTTTGRISWRPSEAQGPGVYPVTVAVTDDGVPPQTVSQTFNISVAETNSAPRLSLVNAALEEGRLWSYRPTVVDADLPANQFTWALGPGAPAGLTVNTTTGELTWTPGEIHGGRSFPVSISVTDDGKPPLSDTKVFSIAVAEVNAPPRLDPIANRTIPEGQELILTAIGHDDDQPAQTLTFRLLAGAPTGASITPGGEFRWTPNESQGPGEFTVGVEVVDNGNPPQRAETRFTLTVTEANAAPVLTVVDGSTEEGKPWRYRPAVADPDLPANRLTWALGAGAPEGLTLDTATGELTWTPGETHGGQSFPVSVTVTDDGTTPLSDTRSFTLTVAEANTAPVLNAVLDQRVMVGDSVHFTATASDTDVPIQALTFSLTENPPDGAAIEPTTGAFTWTPTAAGPHVVRLRVTDNGEPPLSDEQNVRIEAVPRIVEVTITAIRVEAGRIRFEWAAPLGVRYRVQSSPSLVDRAWSDVGTPVVSGDGRANFSDALDAPGPRFYRVIAE